MLEATFWGVRGSMPSPGPHTVRYGGNTSCVVLEVAGEDPLVLDLGLGAAAWASALDGPLRAHALVTHLHWDHIGGLPHMAVLDHPGTVLEILGPGARAVRRAVSPPYFPVPIDDRAGRVSFADVDDEALAIGTAKVVVRSVPHIGRTNGYRIEWAGASVAYISDHQAPPTLDRVDEGVLELADGADLLVHDAQYTEAEYARRSGWGHSTVDYAVLVAREAGARRLALYHHDPARTDDDLDDQLADARRTAARLGVPDVLAAAEGLTVEVGAS